MILVNLPTLHCISIQHMLVAHTHGNGKEYFPGTARNDMEKTYTRNALCPATT